MSFRSSCRTPPPGQRMAPRAALPRRTSPPGPEPEPPVTAAPLALSLPEWPGHSVAPGRARRATGIQRHVAGGVAHESSYAQWPAPGRRPGSCRMFEHTRSQPQALRLRVQRQRSQSRNSSKPLGIHWHEIRLPYWLNRALRGGLRLPSAEAHQLELETCDSNLGYGPLISARS